VNLRTFNRILIIIVLLLEVLAGNDSSSERDQTKNINQFSLAFFPVAHSSEDSIKIYAYLEIPYYALQFVKDGKIFRADYEASIALQDNEGIQLKRQFWQESIRAKDYLVTVSQAVSVILMSEFSVVANTYMISGEIVDLDTKHRGEKTEKVELSKYAGKFVLFPPLALTDRTGEWGFESGKIPAFGNVVRELNNELQIFLSGRVKPGPYELLLKLKSRDGEVLWKETQSFTADTHTFSHIVKIPKDLLKGIKFKLEVKLRQGGKSREKQITIKVLKPGISDLISDIGDALKQMRYILTNEERAKLKNASWKEREKLFQEFWKKRDPTPSTLHNELMEEYYKRVKFANERFSGFQPGWRTDMGMIYILLGPPDDIERTTMPRRSNTYEIWYYYRLNQSFVFVDESGFGEFRLETPFYGTP